MIGGFLNNGTIGEFGYGDFENETVAGIQAGLQFGYKLPSIQALYFINKYLKSLKSASSIGSLASYSDINIYCSDIGDFPFGWDGIKWNDPNLPLAFSNDAVNKVKGRGWRTNGVSGFINRNYIPANESITALDDVFHFAWYTNSNSSGDHIMGANGMIFKTGTGNHGWQLYRGLNIGSQKSGLLRFYAETNASQSFFYDQDVLQSSTNVTVLASKVAVKLLSLARNNNDISVNDYLDPRSIVHVEGSGKRSEINRTLLYNANETFVTDMNTLRE